MWGKKVIANTNVRYRYWKVHIQYALIVLLPNIICIETSYVTKKDTERKRIENFISFK